MAPARTDPAMRYVQVDVIEEDGDELPNPVVCGACLACGSGKRHTRFAVSGLDIGCAHNFPCLPVCLLTVGLCAARPLQSVILPAIRRHGRRPRHQFASLSVADMLTGMPIAPAGAARTVFAGPAFAELLPSWSAARYNERARTCVNVLRHCSPERQLSAE